METSTSIKEIATALLTFHNHVGAVKKSAENPFFKSSYADLPAILEAVKKPLQSAGLSFAQFPVGQHGLTTILMHTSGEWMKATYEMVPVKNDPQGHGSAITYARRYALGAILGISTEEDDDGNSASTKPAQIVKTTALPEKEKRSAYEQAKDSIDNAQNDEELKTLSTRIDKSTKLTADEKESLQFLIHESSN